MKKILSFVLVASLTLSLVSCLKDSDHMEPLSIKNVGMIAEIAGLNIAPSGTNEIDSSFSSATTAPSSFTFNVKISSPSLPTQDIQVTLAESDSALNLFNNNNGTAYIALPASTYKITTPTVTVKAGTQFANVGVQIFASSIDATQPYALPIQITSATGGVVPSGNWGYLVLVPKIRNAYEGTYHSSGNFHHPTAGDRALNADKFLQTVNPNTVQTTYADLGGNGYLMQLVINADNTVTIIPKGATPTTQSQFGTNVYDPKTKTFTLNYKYPGSGGDRVINETLTLK